jgi:thiol-disulfide isomerase/thioredoxin
MFLNKILSYIYIRLKDIVIYSRLIYIMNMNTFERGGQLKSGFLQTAKDAIFKYWWCILLVIVFGILGYFTYKQYVGEKTVFRANRENIEVDPNSNKTATMMLFYVDWCPHCKTAKPEWEDLKSEYEGKNINGYTLVFTEYNCTAETPENEELMNKYKIEGYPTIKLLKDNQVVEYDAKPTKTTMSQFLHTVL